MEHAAKKLDEVRVEMFDLTARNKPQMQQLSYGGLSEQVPYIYI